MEETSQPGWKDSQHVPSQAKCGTHGHPSHHLCFLEFQSLKNFDSGLRKPSAVDEHFTARSSSVIVLREGKF